MPEGENTGMEGLGAFGDASTIAPDFQVFSAHCVTGHWLSSALAWSASAVAYSWFALLSSVRWYVIPMCRVPARYLSTRRMAAICVGPGLVMNLAHWFTANAQSPRVNTVKNMHLRSTGRFSWENYHENVRVRMHTKSICRAYISHSMHNHNLICSVQKRTKRQQYYLHLQYNHTYYTHTYYLVSWK